MNTLKHHTDIDSDKRTDALWVCFALVMVGVAYYPTLVADYVPMDQWRAFRYGLEPGLAGARFDSCVIGASKYFFFTGRWLVWFGECAEHASVAQISDFAPLRIIVLAVVLLSVIAFRRVLNYLFDSSHAATFLAVMVVLLPGYAFMYYQGLTGMPVLLALVFSLLSFPFVSRALSAEERSRKFYFDLGVGGILFISACFIYPIFAFAIIPTAFIYSSFRPDLSFSKRIYLCVKLCVFYATAALTYYLTVKSSIAMAEYFGESIYDLTIYRVDITTDPNEIASRLPIIFRELTRMPLSSFFHLPAWLSIPILFGPAGIMFYEGQRLRWGRSGSILAAIVYLLSIPVILVASVAPWLLSHFQEAPYRHMLPIHFLLVLSFGILITRGIENIRRLFVKQTAHQIGQVTMVAIVAIFSINQITLSQRQVVESSIEINHLRAAYRAMIANRTLWDLKEIHVIRPKQDRGYEGHPIDREFAPATMAHPGHILQMTRAVLREILPLDQLYKLNLVDCSFDRECTQTVPTHALVITQSKYGTPLPELHANHAIIDFSQLNKKPRMIKSYLAPNISASSQYKDHSPGYLLGVLGPYWNAEWSPKYPQWIQFEFSSPERLSMLSVRAQSTRRVFPERAPKAFTIQASHDGKNWTDLLDVKDARFTSEKAWRNFPFENDKEYNFYRIYITANGGDSALLTIQQVALN